ncbi:thiamine pyrophosphate-dependent dehydrogenase E1 component subunit alpha [Seongchinamella unica]|uniref:Thiamine pyrophosphate-dependent dehydrogenase E1 component subunit alpha n=1 Tax=Seongchinamella unica TaxID=2547392 RepID=A0A4R5LRI5_9GAMM|nr:thiamine pyrophosphate-dependent dehydrogenase E1 component subunit alpha [Seongchinamella unica]TDG13317.1 thiamine pyrophosphate-dependent dehydrogenase E1 component subunit alpha [Seongchinamella unica]
MIYSTEMLYQAYRSMKLIREFEERMREEYQRGKLPGFIHMYRNQEAIAVGACMHLGDEDYIASTHRGHGHCIAKGCDIEDMLLELACKQDGICKGKGGSMHIADMSKGMLGANAIVGGGPPIAAGAALTARTLGNGRVSMAFIGDGASDQGTVAEALNLASVLQLPMIFMYENNHFAEFTRNPKPDGRIAERAGAYGMPAVTLDGTDFFAVYEAVADAVQRGRQGRGPSAIEAIASRYYGHFEGDAQQYRDSTELESSRITSDPIPKFLADSRCSDLETARIEQIDAEILASLDAGVERALAAADPLPEQLYSDVYVNYRGESA